MADRLSNAELRKFGLTVGAAFLVLGAISWWRGHELPPRIMWTVAGLLMVPGALAPALLRPVHRGWMALALVLGHVNTRIILTALFYLVFTPIGLIMRLFRDPLNRSLRDHSDTQWIKRDLEPVEPGRYERQF